MIAKIQMIKFFKKIILFWLMSMLLPYTALAIETIGTNLLGVLSITQTILRQVVVLLVSFAVVFFIYGITRYITAGENEDRRTKMKNLMIYGIIGLFVIVSMWGIVYVLVNTFNLNLSQNVEIPYFETSGTSGSSSSSSVYEGG